jgi:ADP-ribose pyrophosphatase
LPDGRQEDFDIIAGENAAFAVAVTKANKIILVRQFRTGTEEIYDEIPAGLIDLDETPMQAARRELLEETGYTGKFKFVTSCPDDAYRSKIKYCFVATECYKLKDPSHDENEFIQVLKKTIEDFKKQVRSGKLTDTDVAYLGLDFLRLL